MKSLDELRTVKRNAESALLKIPGVNCVGIGYKKIGGRKTDKVSIPVCVDKKRRDAGETDNGVIHKTDIFVIDSDKIDGIILSHGHFDHFTCTDTSV